MGICEVERSCNIDLDFCTQELLSPAVRVKCFLTRFHFFVKDPSHPKEQYEIYAEFSCAEDSYKAITFYMYSHNEISEQLSGMYAQMPIEYVASILTRVVTE